MTHILFSKQAASSQWTFRLNSARGCQETATIGKTPLKLQQINHLDARFMSYDSFMIIFRFNQSCFLLKLGGSLFGFEEILESKRNVSQSNRSQYGIRC